MKVKKFLNHKAHEVRRKAEYSPFEGHYLRRAFFLFLPENGGLRRSNFPIDMREKFTYNHVTGHVTGNTRL